MNDNLMKTKGKRSVSTATEILLSDYELGSAASRAAARALLIRKAQMVDDRDALSIYRHAEDCELELKAMVESTRVYERGKELYEGDLSNAPPAFDQVSVPSSASSTFRLAFGREPQLGDVLRYDDVETIYRVYLGLLEQFVQAWARHFPDWPCPLRIDGEQVLIRRRAEWVEKEGGRASPMESWHLIEAEAYGDVHGLADQETPRKKPRARAVVFAGLNNGKARWNPVFSSEIYRERPEATAGVFGVLAQAARRIGLE